MTTAQEESRRKRLCAAARAMFIGEVGLAVGANRVRRSLNILGEEYRRHHPVFDEFVAAIPMDLPFGAVRLRWDPEKVVAHDYRLAAIEARFRERLIRECVEIMVRYGGGVRRSIDRIPA